MGWVQISWSLVPAFSTPPLPYSGTFYAEAVSPDACRSERVPTRVQVFSAESAQIELTADQYTLPEAKVNFAVSTDYKITEWLWNFGDSDTSHLPNPSHIYTIPGVYEVASVFIF